MNNVTNSTTSRRAILGAGLGLAATTLGRRPVWAAAASEKLQLAAIGCGGRGSANLSGLADENFIALCDVDAERASSAFKRLPQAEQFSDFRRMFDKVGNKIDGVVISTPDHTHYHPTMIALQLGKHVYLEKPMAHNVSETRQLTDAAAKAGVATQLGVQRHCLKSVRDAVSLVQGGTIGEVEKVICWIDSARGMPKMPTGGQKVPAHLDYDLWVGPAEYHPYDSQRTPYGWRFWWDYGTGESGNWGCHILDIPFWALGLDYPTRVTASGPKPDALRTPTAMHSEFEFPARDNRAPVKLVWAQAAGGPPELRELGVEVGKEFNTVFVGSEGILLAGFSRVELHGRDGGEAPQPQRRELYQTPGFYAEWAAACRGGEAASCSFDYSGPMAETVLLGNVAYRAGGFHWDARSLSTGSNEKAQELIQEPYREGWSVL